LVDEAETMTEGVVGIVDLHRTPFDGDARCVSAHCAGKDLDERRLAGAVLAHERMDLAGRDGERDRPERGDPGKGFAGVFDSEKCHSVLPKSWSLRAWPAAPPTASRSPLPVPGRDSSLSFRANPGTDFIASRVAAASAYADCAGSRNPCRVI